MKPKKRQHLETDLHHIEHQFCDNENSSSEESENDESESEDEDEQVCEILKRSQRVPTTLGLMNRLLLQTSNLKIWYSSKLEIIWSSDQEDAVICPVEWVVFDFHKLPLNKLHILPAFR